MNNLLIFFALPLATIILAVVLERVLKCYKLVTATFFAIYLIVAFAFFDEYFLVATLIYTLLAFIASYLSMLSRRLNNLQSQETYDESSCGCGSQETEQSVELRANFEPNNANNGRSGRFNGCYRRR